MSSTVSRKSVRVGEVARCIHTIEYAAVGMLANHPDRSYVEFILNGIRDGFRIGFFAKANGCSDNWALWAVSKPQGNRSSSFLQL